MPESANTTNYVLDYQAPQNLAELADSPGSIRGVSLADNVDRVIGVLVRVQQHGPVILVGHSRGGSG